MSDSLDDSGIQGGEEIQRHSSVEETVRHVMTSVLTDLRGFASENKSLREKVKVMFCLWLN